MEIIIYDKTNEIDVKDLMEMEMQDSFKLRIHTDDSKYYTVQKYKSKVGLHRYETIYVLRVDSLNYTNYYRINMVDYSYLWKRRDYKW